MTHVLRALIPAFWILWLGYWIVAARATSETRRRESFVSRLTHYGPLILGGVLLGVPNFLGQELDASSMTARKSGFGSRLRWLRPASAFRQQHVPGWGETGVPR